MLYLSTSTLLRSLALGSALLALDPSVAQATCRGNRCTSYDYALPVTITTTGSSPSLTVMGGNVGIGTTAPAQALDVASGYIKVSREYATGMYMNNTTTGVTYGLFNASAAANGFNGFGIYDGADYNLAIVGGNIGIGTTAPAQRLTVDGTTRFGRDVVLTRTDAGSTAKLVVDDSVTTAISLEKIGGGNITDINLMADTTHISGKVGIGTSAPTYALDVVGDYARVTREYAAGYYINNTTTGVTHSLVGASAAANGFSGFGISDGSDYRLTVVSGNVGIGNTAPAYSLDVTGTMRVTGQAYTNSGNGSFSVLSDARYKDIHGRFERGLSDLLKIETIRYNYTAKNPMGADSKKEYVGITAQNLQTAIPEAVKEEKGYLTANTSPVLWTLVNAVKELYQNWTQDSKDLRKEIESLKTENTELKTYLCSKDTSAPFCN